MMFAIYLYTQQLMIHSPADSQPPRLTRARLEKTVWHLLQLWVSRASLILLQTNTPGMLQLSSRFLSTVTITL